MKSHPGFQAGNFLHALAPYGLAAPSSVLTLVHAANQVWTQTFTARRVDGTELAAAFADARLRLDRYLTDDRT
jgi:hypothetical protein